jgi:site-specific DNA-methyltransferase (adenine-specific)
LKLRGNKMNNFENQLYYGDNLKVLKVLCQKHEPFIDLIYIDPPFNSKRNYNILFEDLIKTKENGKKTTALKEAFKDTWSNTSLSHELDEMKAFSDLKLYNFLAGNRDIFSDSQMSYLTMMAHRLYYMHKILKDTGSIYLHCDPTMSHYLKILMDIIFGVKNFRNELVWYYRRWSNISKVFQRMHDVILFYSKTQDYKFNILYQEYSKPEVIETTVRGIINGKLQRLKDKEGNYLKREKDNIGVAMHDVFQLQHIQPTSKERLGYPTQKPEALLERIIKASSNEGDIVADFFCGCGTSVTVAEKLQRRWLGVDINHLAIGLIEERRLRPLKADYHVIGFPTDQAQAEKLAREKPFEFETWVVEYIFKGHCTRKTADGGYDGHIAFNDGDRKKICLLEVKGGNCTVKNIREFDNVILNKKADMGFFICFKEQVTSGMIKHCDQLGFVEMQDNLFSGTISKLSIITIEDILSKRYLQNLGGLLRNITY